MPRRSVSGCSTRLPGLDNKSFAKVKKNVKRLIARSPTRERSNRTARKKTRAIYAWHEKNIGINTADKFVNGIPDK